VKLFDLCLKKRQSTVGVTGLREGGDVRGCLLAAIMILDLKVTRRIHICDMHNTYARTFKWSTTCSLAGVHVGRAKHGCFVHFWILCGTCAVTAHSSRKSKRSRGLFSPTCNGLGSGEARSSLENSLDLSMT